MTSPTPIVSPQRGARACAEELPRLLVLAGFTPESTGGGVVLRGILNDYPAERLFWQSLTPVRSGTAWWRPEVPRGASRFYIPGARFTPVRALWRCFGYRLEAGLAAQAALAAVRRFAPDVCWAVLDHHVVLAIRSFIHAARLPVHVSVHDDPVIAARMLHTGLPLASLERAFAECLTIAASRDCISSRMAECYRSKYAVESFVVTHGIDGSLLRCRRAAGLPDTGPIRVALAGAMSPGDESLQPLLRALDLLESEAHRPFQLHLFGSTHGACSTARLTAHRLLTDADFDSLMRTMHVGFASDPPTEIGSLFAATSFSTKVVTYIAFGMPFLYVGPRQSTVADLLAHYPAGVLIDSPSHTEIASGLRRIMANYERMQQACADAASAVFDLHKIRQELLGALRNTARTARCLPF